MGQGEGVMSNSIDSWKKSAEIYEVKEKAFISLYHMIP